MIEALQQIFKQISFEHLNILLLLGLGLFGGAIGGRIFQKLRIPQVVGYISIGIIIGRSGANIIDQDVIHILEPFSFFALGLIGFMIGGELRKDILQKYGKQFLTILCFEGFTTFILVFLLVGWLGSFLFNDSGTSWAMGLLLGAIASATAPAATTEVLWEYKTKGPLTTTVFGIVALDDAFALLLFAIAASLAEKIIGHTNAGIFTSIMQPAYEIIGAIIIGILSGLVLSTLLKKYTESDRMLAFSIGTVLGVLGLSQVMQVDMLLSAMALGVVVANCTPQISKQVFSLVKGFTPPIYVLFFVLVGAKLDLRNMTLAIVIFAFVYLIGRTLGKAMGARIGSRIAKAPLSVQKYLGFCLFDQAGVAIGLSIIAYHIFPGDIGNNIVIIVAATTFAVQIIGPPFIKMAVTRAGEVGLNITEEDLIQQTKIKDIMELNPPRIHKNDTLARTVKIFSSNNNLYYPVVDDSDRLVGIISVDNIKHAVLEMDVGNLILAVDFMESCIQTVSPDEYVVDAKQLIEKYNLEYLPVVDGGGAIAGFIERRTLTKAISTKMLELQKKADSL